MPPKKSQPLNDEEYQAKRARNNAAVNRTREKRRREDTQTTVQVDQLMVGYWPIGHLGKQFGVVAGGKCATGI